VELDKRLTEIEKKLDYIIEQEKNILNLMVKFIDHVEEIEEMALQVNRIKN